MLDAAEAEFAARGFAGARIDEIAARAGMAKSHVYYHFAGKQQIFDALVATRLEELLRDKQALLDEFDGRLPSAGELKLWVSRAITELLMPRSAFLRIVLVEGLAGSQPGEPSLLSRMLGSVVDDIVARFAAHGLGGDTDQLRSDALWFGLVPAVLHVVLRQDAAAALGLSLDRTTELFLSRLADLEAALLAGGEFNPVNRGGIHG